MRKWVWALAALAAWSASVPRVARAQYGRDAVVARVAELAARDASSSTLVGTIEAGRLSQGESATRAYRLSSGSCYWFVAAGDGNVQDLDLLVRLRGAEVARDQGASRDLVVPGERPYCPPEQQRVQARVVAFQGGGSYAIGVYQGAAPPEPTDVRAVLERAGVRHAPGLSLAGEPRVARLVQGEDLSQEIRLQGGNCYRFVVVGGAGVEDVELHVYLGSSEIARDAAMSTEAVASYCATADGAVQARVRMYAGSGEIALGAFTGGRQQTGAQSGAPTPEATPAIPVGGSGDDFLGRQLRLQHGRVGQGREAVTQVLRASLRSAEEREFPLQLEAGRCYTVIAVGPPSVRNLDLYLADPSGLEVASDTGPEASAVVHTNPCPRWAGTYTARVRVFSGYGQVGLQAFGN